MLGLHQRQWNSQYSSSTSSTTSSPQFYLVTGGNSGSAILSSTEIQDPRTGSWQEASPLPRQLYGLACGSPRPGTVVCAGGYDGGYRDEVSDGLCPLICPL